ncbi:MAG: hypothetical protein KAR20_02880 [Candidatus Heimdallarchaeota archaeon]|nr:hypothetical protein [Candidatus Heimdallarchaeota archaeon]
MNLLLERKSNLHFTIIALLIIMSFSVRTILFPSTAYSQTVLNLPSPGTMVFLSESYAPAVIRGINIYPNEPLKFDFTIDIGDSAFTDDNFQYESLKLIRYFMASLTLEEKEMWVNLSPYEDNRIIHAAFGQTEMGRDLLAQDYMLKQLSATLMHPDKELGEKFWQKVYEETSEKYGTIDIQIDTFNKIWIVPKEAIVHEHKNGAFIVSSHLSVMLEEDYLALESNLGHAEHGLGDVSEEDLHKMSDVSLEIVREIIIPKIEHEVNYGKTFANLRQIYNSMILAVWYKRALKDSLLGKVYVNKEKVYGIELDDSNINLEIYDQYVESFKKGVFNFIKDEYDSDLQEIIPRKYFSGGAISPTDENVTSGDFSTLAKEAAKENTLRTVIAEMDAISRSGSVGTLDDLSNLRMESDDLNDTTTLSTDRLIDEVSGWDFLQEKKDRENELKKSTEEYLKNSLRKTDLAKDILKSLDIPAKGKVTVKNFTYLGKESNINNKMFYKITMSLPSGEEITARLTVYGYPVHTAGAALPAVQKDMLHIHGFEVKGIDSDIFDRERDRLIPDNRGNELRFIASNDPNLVAKQYGGAWNPSDDLQQLGIVAEEFKQGEYKDDLVADLSRMLESGTITQEQFDSELLMINKKIVELTVRLWHAMKEKALWLDSYADKNFMRFERKKTPQGIVYDGWIDSILISYFEETLEFHVIDLIKNETQFEMGTILSEIIIKMGDTGREFIEKSGFNQFIPENIETEISKPSADWKPEIRREPFVSDITGSVTYFINIGNDTKGNQAIVKVVDFGDYVRALTAALGRGNDAYDVANRIAHHLGKPLRSDSLSNLSYGSHSFWTRMQESGMAKLIDTNDDPRYQMEPPQSIANYEIQELLATIGNDAVKRSNKNVGGIDLNPENMNFNVRGELVDLNITIDPRILKRMENIDGFTPSIINIVPIINLELLLGVSESSDEVELNLFLS